MATPSQIVLSGIIGTIGQPQTYNRGAKRTGDIDTLQHMLDGLAAYGWIAMAQTAQPIHVLLKQIWVDRTNRQAQLFCRSCHVAIVIDSIPGNMDGDGRANASNALHLGGVREFFIDSARRTRPGKNFKTCARVAITPGGSFYFQLPDSG